MQNKIKMEKLKCLKCGHSWKQRGKTLPKKCPCCTNPNWNIKTNKNIIDFLIK